MNLVRILSQPVKVAKVVQSVGFGLASSFALNRQGTVQADEVHLAGAIDWLKKGQDAVGGRGVSTAYRLAEGWTPDAYPETSGYIIETFIDYQALTGDSTLLDRAVQLGDWEIEIQHPSGGVRSAVGDPDRLRVFNTGQVILGWVALYRKTRQKQYLEAAKRASEYLIRLQEEDGSWQKDTHCGGRTYHARVSWALLLVAKETEDQRFLNAALKNLKWILAQQQESGWFANCGFFKDAPITHTIFYTLSGLIESHRVIRDAGFDSLGLDLLTPVSRASSKFVQALSLESSRRIPFLPCASYNPDWSGDTSSSCLTGNAQAVIVLLDLANEVSAPQDREKFTAAANGILDVTKSLQNVKTEVAGVRGALGGSFPISAQYCSYQFPNWATKFLADALMRRIA